MRENCITDREIQDYLDGVTIGKARAQLEKHLEICSNCEKRMKQFQFIFDGLESIEVPELPANFAEKTLAFVKNEKARILRRRTVNISIAAAIAFILVFFVPLMNLLTLAGVNTGPVLNFLTEMKLEFQLFLNYLINIFNVILVLNSGFKSGQLLNGIIWGGIAAVFILFLKLKDRFSVLHQLMS